MDKKSNEHLICRYCDKEAIPGTYPPVCVEHSSNLNKKAAQSGSLKELEDDPGIWEVED